ncbi:MAG: hypothetical protein ACRC3B_02165 [Bacteroidia bacterium]
MITRAIHTAYKTARERNWSRTYWAVDIHGTMMPPTHRGGDLPKTFYAHAREVLQLATLRDDICLILYTCSHEHEVQEYLAFFEEHEIRFDFVNENPEVQNTSYGNYDRKPYFNVLFEDKAGFDPENDWDPVLVLLNDAEALKLL